MTTPKRYSNWWKQWRVVMGYRGFYGVQYRYTLFPVWLELTTIFVTYEGALSEVERQNTIL